jgi:hypothetical protein
MAVFLCSCRFPPEGSLNSSDSNQASWGQRWLLGSEYHAAVANPGSCLWASILWQLTTRAHSRRVNDARYVTERGPGVEWSAMVGQKSLLNGSKVHGPPKLQRPSQPDGIGAKCCEGWQRKVPEQGA